MNRPKTVVVKNFPYLSVTLLILAGLGFGQPTLTVSPKNNPPTTNVLVSASGFSAYAAIDIYFDTTDEALASANAAGAFSNISIPVPASAQPGRHWITAVQRSNDESAQTPFTVNTNWAEFGFTLNGKRSNPYENVLGPGTVGTIDEQWRFTTSGQVQSSPAVVNGIVYVGSNDGNVYALNAKTGAKVWRFATEASPGGNAVGSSPAVANGVVYVGSCDGNVYALNGASGAKLWSFSTPFTVSNCVDSPPAVAKGVVYVGSDNSFVYALNAKTGAKLWSFGTGDFVSSAPAVFNGMVCVGSSDANVYALNAATGAKLWSFTADTGVGSCAVADGVMYVGSSDGKVYALNATTGAKLWSFTTNTLGLPLSSSSAVANGVLYIGSYDGKVYALNATTGAKLWTFTTGGYVASSPAVAYGVVYVGSGDDNVYALNAKTGAKLWSFTTGDVVLSSPAVTNGVVYVGSNDNSVYAFSEKGALASPSEKRPEPRTLRPDFSLEISKPLANIPNDSYNN